MYGWMLFTYTIIFPYLHLHEPGYWFMMQFAMLLGFLTAYPMNYFLLRIGLKEAMT